MAHQARAAATRRQILDAARVLFADRGYPGTTFDAIAEQAGVARGSVFWHFRTKEALLGEVVLDSYHGFADALVETIGERIGLDALRAYAAARREMLRVQPHVDRLGYVLLGEAVTTQPALREPLRRAYDEFTAVFEKWLHSGVEAGQLRSDIDMQAIAELFRGAMSNATQEALLTGDVAGLERSHNRILAALETALTP